MMRQFYAMPLPVVAVLMLALLLLWTALCQHFKGRIRTFSNVVLACAATLIILHATLLSRTPGIYTAVLTPFAALAAARQQPELYREMLMNVFLFFPLGLTLSNALPRTWHRWLRIVLTTLTGCVLSAGIEYAQYRFALGMAETDDVICNTLGAFIGASSLLLAHAMEKHKERPTTMTLTATETQFLHIAKIAVSAGELPTEAADWPAIFTLANQQKLLPILFEAVRKTPAAEENAPLFAAIKQQVIGQVLNQTVRSAEFADLYRRLRAAGLHPVVVKGQLCSRLYSLRDHRISADDDLFIPEGEFFACHQALLANGLTTDTPADELPTADEVSYTKKDSPLYIELHRHLFDSAEDAHDELNHFFVDIAPVEVDGFLTMPPHEHLLYLILHAYKHFVRSGIGLRQFCDIGLWARAYHDQIDWQRLHDQCASVHAATFAAAAFRIAQTYLGIDFDLPSPWNSDVDVEPLLHDALCGGVYGSNDYTRLHSSTVTLNAVKASRTGEKSSVLRTVFPKREYLERRYPYLKKRPYLLPVAWVQRIAHYAGEQSGADNSASGSIKLAKERIELMKLYGIIDQKYHARLGKFDDMAHSENILKGLVYCRHCGRPLVRYKNVSHGKKLWYTFICPTHAQNPDSCPFVSIREDELLEVLNASVQTQIALACDMDSLVTRKNAVPAVQKNRSAAGKKLDAARRTLKRSQSLYDSLYQNYVEQLITESEYAALKARYQAEQLEAERLIAELEAHAAEQRQLTQENAFLTGFQAFQGQTALDSEMAHALISRIEIDADRNANISFRYRDEYLALAAYLEEGAQ